MDLGLKNKNILITGAAKRIGKELASAAAAEGANIGLHYRKSEAEALETAEAVSKYGVKVSLVQGDIASLDEVKQMKEKLNTELGTIDSIVNNAGWAKAKPFFNYEPEEWKKEVDICFYGVVNLAYTFIPDMITGNRGKFINITGDSARTGDRHLIISAAARNGAISFMKSLAMETGRNNIQCNTVSLGLIDQEPSEFNEETLNKLAKKYPLKRLGKPEDIKGAVLFLLSDSADWITGQVIPVNGGYSMLG